MKSDTDQPHDSTGELADFLHDLTETVLTETDSSMSTCLLIAQNCDAYLPIAIVTEDEAEEFARQDMARRSPENDDFCPEEYALWKHQPDGRFAIARTISV